MSEETKVCSRCQLSLSLEEFYDKCPGGTTKRGKCKKCYGISDGPKKIMTPEEKKIRDKENARKYYLKHKEYHINYRKVNKDKIKESIKSCKERNLAKNPNHYIELNKRTREKKLASLSEEELVAYRKKRCGLVVARQKTIYKTGKRHSKNDWLLLLKLADGKCLKCGSDDRVGRDHVMPLSNGGDDGIMNIQPLCLRCNASKSDNNTDYRSQDFILLMKSTFEKFCLYCGKPYFNFHGRDKYCSDKCTSKYHYAKSEQNKAVTQTSEDISTC